MVIENWGDATTQALQLVWQNIIVYLPRILLALILFLVGWILAVLFQRLVVQVLRAVKIDHYLEKMGAGDAIEHAGIKLDVAGWIGFLVKWFFIFVGLLAASDMLKLNAVSGFFRQVIDYIPEIVVAAVILIVGVWFANFLKRLVMTSISAGQMHTAAFVGTIVKWAVLVFALFAALDHVKIADDLLKTLITGFIAMLAIAGGLAFGLGGKDQAAKFLSTLKDKMSE